MNEQIKGGRGDWNQNRKTSLPMLTYSRYLLAEASYYFRGGSANSEAEICMGHCTVGNVWSLARDTMDINMKLIFFLFYIYIHFILKEINVFICLQYLLKLNSFILRFKIFYFYTAYSTIQVFYESDSFFICQQLPVFKISDCSNSMYEYLNRIHEKMMLQQQNGKPVLYAPKAFYLCPHLTVLSFILSLAIVIAYLPYSN